MRRKKKEVDPLFELYARDVRMNLARDRYIANRHRGADLDMFYDLTISDAERAIVSDPDGFYRVKVPEKSRTEGKVHPD